MVTIDSLGNSSATGVFQLNKNEQEEQRKAIDERLRDGDTVKISAEAMELFKSKMEEYGASNPGDLTKDQKEDLKDTMESFAEENGIDPENMPRPGRRPGEMPPEGEGGNPGGKGDRGMGGGKQAAASGAAGGTSSSSSTDVEDKEDEIEELESEIQQLRSEATNDEKAAEKLKTKEVELAALQAELALLESQSA
ncbi:hypothetical protein [Desulfovibrio sp. JC022]|uniref:hypothetical protein n=1 Tax=Desulfovibrio sp. JC022 TaxID=2593642 RepID=UPI0013D41A99|nr:hypothetical protein [Desulfovibrio sp. JC022]NDV21182.1 hypothetical protein [Desulfovibrio sp. JC022]